MVLDIGRSLVELLIAIGSVGGSPLSTCWWMLPKIELVVVDIIPAFDQE